jgi:hypothetical protein
VNVGLVDIDNTGFPNLALMKLSSYHKCYGNSVELTFPLFAQNYDKVYASKVFSWTPLPVLPPKAEIGGSGYSIDTKLEQKINDLCPDYNLYNIDYSIGFLTRGCYGKCEWCIVPEKEGKLRPEHDIGVFLRHNKAVLLDNNVLAHQFGIDQVRKIVELGIKIDFNQGLDARFIDSSVAGLLARVRWLRPIRLSCDTNGMMGHVKRAVELLRSAGATPSNYSCYVLVKDIPSALERVEFLRRLKVDPFAQPYRDAEGTQPTEEQRRFARWVNHKAIFKSVKWEDYT